MKSILDKDVERTYVERDLFQTTEVKDLLAEALMSWSIKNKEIGYRQGILFPPHLKSYQKGMSDLFAFIMIAYDMHYVNYKKKKDKSQDEDPFLSLVTDRKFMIHDSYIIFDSIMTGGLMEMFVHEVPGKRPVKKKKFMRDDSFNYKNIKLPITKKAADIFDGKLKTIDFELHFHLESVKLEPQWFLLRWLRMFFIREFHMDDSLKLWTNIFWDFKQSNPKSFE